jgi:hypothetical protein
MKIHQLPLGARFEFDGGEYVKTGPLVATGKGGQRLIPKYAVLKVIGDTGNVAAEKKSDMLSRAQVLAAFDTFYADCRVLLAPAAQTPLASARERFLQSLA